MEPLKRKGQPAPILTYQNQPTGVRVLTGPDGMPTMVQEKHSRRMVKVVRVRDHWRVDDSWWREPVSRHYYEVELASGSVECFYLDEVAGEWFRQRYEQA